MRFKNLTAKHRNTKNNDRLGVILALVAGAINAGGFFLIMQYTSHMTGIISLAADSVAIGEYAMSLRLIGYILCFILGAACTTMIALYAKRYRLHSQFAFPLLLEALVLMVFCVSWYFMASPESGLSYFIVMLCFVMGVQNALITKVSSAIIRTTHITGMATDLGIEIGRYCIGRHNSDLTYIQNNMKRHVIIIASFFVGGVLGAMGINMIGAFTFFIIALVLVAIGLPQFIRDYILYSKLSERKKTNRSYKA